MSSKHRIRTQICLTPNLELFCLGTLCNQFYLTFEVLPRARSHVRYICICVHADAYAYMIIKCIFQPPERIIKIYSLALLFLEFSCYYFPWSLLIPLIFTASLINKSRMQCDQFTLGILTLATVVYFHQMMYLSFKPFRHWWGWRKKKCLCELYGDKCFLFCIAWQDGGGIFYK